MNDIFVFGRGNVGKALLSQFAYGMEHGRIPMRVMGVFGKNASILDSEPVPPDILYHPDSIVGPALSGAEVLEKIAQLSPSPIIVDVTSEDHGKFHAQCLRQGWSVVTANKKPLTTDMITYEQLMRHDARYGYEATVGAGLPVLGTIRDFIAAGDIITEISGTVSGTLGYIFSACENGLSFQDAIFDAKRLGYTEPDPNDDLCGKDVARKALILARLLGHRLEIEDIPCESLVGRTDIDSRIAKAKEKGNTLRYAVTVTDEDVSVGLKEVSKKSALGSCFGPENIFIIHTKRYCHTPLVIRGPGAGADVTAMGVFGDVVRLCNTQKIYA